MAPVPKGWGQGSSGGLARSRQVPGEGRREAAHLRGDGGSLLEVWENSTDLGGADGERPRVTSILRALSQCG